MGGDEGHHGGPGNRPGIEIDGLGNGGARKVGIPTGGFALDHDGGRFAGRRPDTGSDFLSQCVVVFLVRCIDVLILPDQGVLISSGRIGDFGLFDIEGNLDGRTDPFEMQPSGTSGVDVGGRPEIARKGKADRQGDGDPDGFSFHGRISQWHFRVVHPNIWASLMETVVSMYSRLKGFVT